MPKFSFIIPVYNRPSELEELLSSMVPEHRQHPAVFEVIVVEDGSQVPCKTVADVYAGTLNLKYVWQENGGPGAARNCGARHATGEYLIFLDSDTLLPRGYVAHVISALETDPADLFGGPDRAADDFTVIQKAIDYSMTSFFTTGGIRGGKKRVDKFYPRTFNMGVKKEVFDAVGGFGSLRFGEDLDLSMRILEAGYHSECYADTWVYHKRRVSFSQFFKQVYNSGIARITLNALHPGTLKAVHAMPSVFVVGHLLLLLLVPLHTPWWLLLPPLYALLVFLDALLKKRDVKVALYAIVAAYVQLFGYGCGFLEAVWQRLIKKKGVFTKFDKNFYD